MEFYCLNLFLSSYYVSYENLELDLQPNTQGSAVLQLFQS